MPLSIWPSLFWEGNDGPWSTFAIQLGGPVGNPAQAQVVNLLPAISGSSIWPVNYQGCSVPTNQSVTSDPSNCDELRGGVFNPELTGTGFSAVNAADGKPYVTLPFSQAEASVGYASSAAAGTTKVTLGTTKDAHVLDNQLIAAFAHKDPILGLLGVSEYYPNALNINESVKSPLRALHDSGAVSGLSFGYTAGANYNTKPWGSLTMGGYDQLRGDPKEGIAFPLQLDNTRDLVVRINSITIGSNSSNVNIEAVIDSIIPEIWLPSAACQAFVDAFDLVYNSTAGTGYYIVSEEQHTKLLKDNTGVTFKLAANASSSAPTVDIVLPYAAFDLELKFPKANITDSSTAYRYFPLQVASNENQYVLGRTFLQEAYLAVDYDNKEFHISQAKAGPGSSTTNLICLGSCKSSGLSTGAIAGIAVGIAVVVLAVVGYLAWRWWKKRKVQKLRADLLARTSIGGTTIQEDETPNNLEFFKPSSGPPEEEIKPELDGQSAIPAGFVQYGRHELASNGSVRRTSQQSGLSRGTISPITQRMPSHSRNMSYGSSNGQPSPSLGESPSPGQGPWSPSSHPSPGSEMREVRHESGGQWYFELPANGSRPALQQVEPVEVRADPRSPVERTQEPDSLL